MGKKLVGRVEADLMKKWLAEPGGSGTFPCGFGALLTEDAWPTGLSSGEELALLTVVLAMLDSF